MFSQNLQENIPSIVTFFSAALQKNKLSHAYLLCGSDSALKYSFSIELAQILNCESKNACGKCMNCKWLMSSTHPEVPIVLEPDLEKSKKGVILVDQAEYLLGRLQYKSKFYRVIIVKTAERESFPTEVANSFLKTIEEPNPNTLFLFYSLDREAVLPTITSRCQIINFPNSKEFNNLLEEEAKIIFNKLCNSSPNWFRTSQLALEIADSKNFQPIDFLDAFTEYLIKQNIFKTKILKLINTAKNRLKGFCSPKPALEELFWELKNEHFS